MNTLPKLEDLTNLMTWNHRYRLMQEVLHTTPEARKLIVDALTIISQSKDLSFGERKMLDHAQNYDRYRAELDAKVVSLDAYRKKVG